MSIGGEGPSTGRWPHHCEARCNKFACRAAEGSLIRSSYDSKIAGQRMISGRGSGLVSFGSICGSRIIDAFLFSIEDADPHQRELIGLFLGLCRCKWVVRLPARVRRPDAVLGRGSPRRNPLLDETKLMIGE